MAAILDKDFIGNRVSHYDIVSFIGSGGMGKVYLGRDEQLRRHVAIKVLFADRIARSPKGLLTEAQLLSRLAHPHVAAIYDFISDNHRDYMVMEFVPGATLEHVLAAGPLPAEEVVRLGLQLARGVAAAHAARVLHRDLKPQNIKVTPSGRLKILDFGVASMLPAGPSFAATRDTSSATHPGGTIPYMSPEQLRGEVLDERSDIFSIGALLYEMAAGRPAFPQRHVAQLVEAIQHDDPPLLTSVNPFVPRKLEDVVRTALQKSPARRHPRAAVLVSDLLALASPEQETGAVSSTHQLRVVHRCVSDVQRRDATRPRALAPRPR